jgi:hypothetical protein
VITGSRYGFDSDGGTVVGGVGSGKGTYRFAIELDTAAIRGTDVHGDFPGRLARRPAARPSAGLNGTGLPQQDTDDWQQRQASDQ